MPRKPQNAFDLVRHYPDATVLLGATGETVVAGPWYDYLTARCAAEKWPARFTVDLDGLEVTWAVENLVASVHQAVDGVLEEFALATVYGFRAEAGGSVVLQPVPPGRY